uniref:Reverse transcriptase domain-containing protein n=1 Tax=Chrysemys picta bellii TaxID=8478 RepID=A0A8C3HLJ1_CHRPI
MLTIIASKEVGLPTVPTNLQHSAEPSGTCNLGLCGETGIKIGHTEQNTMLYVDDMLVLPSDPQCSIPKLLELHQGFGHSSGYKINCSKSEALGLTKYTQQACLVNWIRRITHNTTDNRQ